MGTSPLQPTLDWSALRPGAGYLRRVGGFGTFEIVVVRMEARPGGKDIVGEQLHVGVVVLERFIVAPPLDRKAGFSSGELVLQAKKTLVGLEAGIVLSRSKQAAQGSIQLGA